MKYEQTKLHIRKAAVAGIILLGLSSPNLSFADHGGTNSGGDNSVLVFKSWCHDVDTILDEAETIAKIQYSTGNLIGAKNILVQGIVDALKAAEPNSNSINSQQSLTVRVLTRGLDIATAVSIAAPDDLDRYVRILQYYYKFARETADSLDRNFYYRLHHDKDHEFKYDSMEFERQYEKYAEDQINWLIGDFFIYDCSDVYSGRVNQKCVYGTNNVFFKLAELITGYVKNDLEDLLVSSSFECAALKLGTLNKEIAQYNLGTSILGTPDVALNIVVYPKLSTIAAQIHVQDQCGLR
jgi:hypothetical protein